MSTDNQDTNRGESIDESNGFEPTWGYIWGVRLLVAFAVVALVAIWLIGYYGDGITDRAGFITVNTLAVLAFVITVIGAFTSRETAHTARLQAREMELQRKASEDTVWLTGEIVREMKAQRELADTQIAQTGLQLIAARDQVIQMIGQHEVMKEQMAQNEEFFVLGNMPAIVVVEAHLEDSISSGKAPIAHFYIANHGQGVANDVRVSFGYGAFRDERLKAMREGKIPEDGGPVIVGNTRGVIAPNSPPKHFNTPRKDAQIRHERVLPDLLNGERVFFMFGQISYLDMRSNKYVTQFCFYAPDIDNPKLSYTTAYNRVKRVPADYEISYADSDATAQNTEDQVN